MGKHHIAKLLRAAPQHSPNSWLYQPVVIVLAIITCTLLLAPTIPNRFYEEEVYRITRVSDLKSIECDPRNLYESLLRYTTILEAVQHSNSPCLVQLYAMSPNTKLYEVEHALQHATHSPAIMQALLLRVVRPQFIWSAMTHALDVGHTDAYFILMYTNVSFFTSVALLAASCTIIVWLLRKIIAL